MEAESDIGNGVLRYDRMSDIDKGEQTVYYIKHDIEWKMKKYPKKEAGLQRQTGNGDWLFVSEGILALRICFGGSRRL